LVCLLAAGCAKGPLPQGPVRDLLDLSQDPAAYLYPDTADEPLFGELQARSLAREFVAAHFAPWHRSWPVNDAAKVFDGLKSFDCSKMFGETRQPRTPDWLAAMKRRSIPEGYPNARLRAISVANTSMRVLPTDEPAFLNFYQAGEGYPFDYLQNSAVWAQTPLFVSHFSDDGAWALCESRFAYGWIPVADIAMVDDAFVRTFEQADLLALTADRVPLYDDFGLFRFEGRIGMVLPRIGDGQGSYEALIAVRDALGRAQLGRTRLTACEAAPFPLAPTPATLAALARELMGQPYGWGGMYGHRDCSAMVMDLFAPLGLDLPRNSSQQAKAGRYLSLEGLSLQDKTQRILALAQPWRTLFWMPGHIVLYIGQDGQEGGRPMILHTTWGVKTKAHGAEGRRFIGATVITTLEPGAELLELAKPEGVLLYRIKGMTLLPN